MNRDEEIVVQREDIEVLLKDVEGRTDGYSKAHYDRLKEAMGEPVRPMDRIWCEGSMSIASDDDSAMPLLRLAGQGTIPLDADDFREIAKAGEVWIPFLEPVKS